MNKHLMAAMFDTAKAESICYAIDEIFMEDAEDRLQYMFQSLWDIVKKISGELDKVSEDCRVVDVIYAVNDVRRKAGEN